MVGRQKEMYGWEFIFLGANIDAAKEAGRMGIAPERTAKFKCDSVGVQLNYSVLSDAVSEFRTAKCMSANWKSRIDDDYKKRGNKGR